MRALLSKGQIQFRCWAVALGAAAFALVGLAEPAQLGKLTPVRPSCGALTGLPCVFCGMTRGVHHLLHGRIAEATYYNWLSLPFLLGAIAVAVMLVIEAASRRRVIPVEFGEFSARKICFAGCVLTALWALNAYLAVSQHKHELLNPAGIFYSFFVR